MQNAKKIETLFPLVLTQYPAWMYITQD